ncbi:MAG: aminotransferase class V-fold PLP-dependent enzyme [bacterium]|nr:aminotransferase class V-fold PLP-dependent enzyme [bacterium]
MTNQCEYIVDDKNLDINLGEKVKADFPIFKNNDAIYFDNSSTTQKPQCVIDSINSYYTKYCANIGRGSYSWANKAEAEVEKVRQKIASFIGANIDEIFFTSGATDASNLIAYGYGLKNIDTDDEIMYCSDDHKSTYQPWENLVKILADYGKKVIVKNILIDTEGDYKEDDLIDKISPKTKVIILTHIHNTYGLEMDIKKIVPRIRVKNPLAKIVLDCSQSVGHIPINLKKLDVDFAFFSGHKMFADTGIGVCYIKKSTQSEMQKFKVGGGNNLFEVGTQNISGILSLGSAVDYINSVGIDKIESYIRYITRYLYSKLKVISQIKFSKGIDKCSCPLGFGIISFSISGIQSCDVGDVLNDYNIFVRTGDFCRITKDEDFIRVSLHIYNTIFDIDKFVKAIKYIVSEK